jgi:transcriptional regulator with XRE-family HTH domain
MQKTIYSSDYAKLLNWLREQRQSQGLTMRDLGKKLKIHHSWVGKVEQGERRLDVMEYLQLCNALNADPHEGLSLLQGRL